MRINPIKANYLTKTSNLRRSAKVSEPQNLQPEQNGLSSITFKAGNKKQAIFLMAESKPYFQKGGVATVMDDMRSLKISEEAEIPDKNSREFWAQKDKVFVDHIYNAKRDYDTNTGSVSNIRVDEIPINLPDDSPFKPFEGKPFMTKDPKYVNYANAMEYFNAQGKGFKPDNNIIHILEDVTGVDKKMMDFGGLGESEIKLYRVLRYDPAKNEVFKTHDFKIFTDMTAGMLEPYGDGSYATTHGNLSQSWKGDPYAKSSKAMVEMMERICEVVSEDGNKFDPATIVMNDSQVSYATEYMAQKAVKGEEFWKGKKPTMIVHNAGDGYIQATDYMNMFVNIADKELRNAIEKDPDFAAAMKNGDQSRYFKSLLPKECFDDMGRVSPFRNTMYYAKLGYVPTISTVSEEYAKALGDNPNLAPANRAMLKELQKDGRFIGILNGFVDEGLNPYTLPGLPGYSKEQTLAPDVKIKGQDGFKIHPYVAFEKDKINSDNALEHFREVKRQNKINLLRRFDPEVLSKLSTLEHQKDFSMLIAGLGNRDVKVHGYIDPIYIDKLEKKEDVKLFVSWGRGDYQKSFDSTLEAFERYVKTSGKDDPNTVLIMGGAFNNVSDPEAIKIKNILNRMESDPIMRGRFAYIEGFAPNKPLASAADYSVILSRFAPCELTDLESMKVFSSPIVANCQGLAQKNFDPANEAEKAKATGYKTVHEFNMTEEEIGKILEGDLKTKFENDVKAFKDEIIVKEKLTKNIELKDENLMEKIRTDYDLMQKYKEVLRPYQDEIIISETVSCFDRAIKDRGTNVPNEILKNLVNMSMGWEDNAALHGQENISSAAKYRKTHFNADGKEIQESDTLLAKLRESCQKAIKRGEDATAKREGQPVPPVETGGFMGKIKNFFGSKGGKWTLGITGGLALAGAGYALYNNNKHVKPSDISNAQSVALANDVDEIYEDDYLNEDYDMEDDFDTEEISGKEFSTIA